MRPFAPRLFAGFMVAVTVASVLASLGLDFAGTARAVEIDVPAQLPTARNGHSVFTDGTFIYALGGASGNTQLDQVVRYDPATGAVEVRPEDLPSARMYAAHAWTGQHLYLFGGFGGTHTDAILRYDPAAGSFVTMAARLPTARSYASAVWTGQAIFVFGGSDAQGQYLDDILRYEPDSDTLTLLAEALPGARDSTAAVWTGSKAYVIGGEVPGTALNDIVSFDPITEQAQSISADLPLEMGRVSAAWDGAHVWVLGARDGTTYHRDIVRFDPSQETVETLGTKLPTGRCCGGAAFVSGTLYHLGGFRGSDVADIVRITFVLAPPTGVVALAGPADGTIGLSWDPAIGSDVPDRLRIYRWLAGEAPRFHAEVPGDASSFTDAGLSGADTRYYHLSSMKDGKEGRPSATVCTAPAPWHLLPSLDPPCAAPAGWTETVLLRQGVGFPGLQGLEGPVVIEGGPSEDDARYYTIRPTVGGFILPDVSVFTGGVVQQPLRIEAPGAALAADRVDVRVIQREQPTLRLCVVLINEGCAVAAPIDPSSPGLAQAAQSEVSVEATFSSDGEVVHRQSVRIPLVGQAGAALPG